MSGRQRACLAAHGFGPRRPLGDLRDPAVRSDLIDALRTCGVLPPAPGPTTTTTSTPPIIIS